MKACAKINLFLKVNGRRSDGYHDLEMVNVSIDLADEVTLEPAETLSLRVNNSALPADARNIAWRAASAWGVARGVSPNYRICIDKNIPVGAGLAGGSTDAAAVLKLLGGEGLSEIGLTLGADIPYCLYGRPAVVRGIGEIIEPIAIPETLHFVLVNPGFEVSTRTIFENITSYSKGSSKPLVDALAVGDLDSICAHISNDLEPVTRRLNPKVDDLIRMLQEHGAVGAFMSGSGPTVYGLYRSASEAKTAVVQIKSAVPFACYATLV